MSRGRKNRPSGRRKAKILACAKRPRSTISAWKSAPRSPNPRRRPKADGRHPPLQGAKRRRNPLIRRKPMNDCSASFARGLIIEPECADMSVLFVRPQHAVGEVAAVRRIRIDLRLEAKAGMRSVMRAVETWDRAIELGRVIELHARLGRRQIHAKTVFQRAQ